MFHFTFNYVIFMLNYMNGVYIWEVNSNGIGEANFEAVMMTLIIPFLIVGVREILILAVVKQDKGDKLYIKTQNLDT